MNKLTIAIPVFERTEFFKEALQSAINQTGPVNIIVVDNASSHNFFSETVEALNLDYVKYYRNDTNLGMYGNWNKCIELCESEFVGILGDDDYLHNNYAETFYNLLNTYPQIVYFHFGYERLITDGKLEKPEYKAPIGLHTGTQLLENAVQFSLNINTNGLIFSKFLYPKFQYLHTKWSYNQDYLFAYSSFAGNCGYGCKDPLITIRVNPAGNAIIVGLKAYISTSLVYKSIKETFSKTNNSLYKAAANKEKWVLRNLIILGGSALVQDMISEPENPFGANLNLLLDNDLISRLSLKSSGILKKSFIIYMRFLRKLDSTFK